MATATCIAPDSGGLSFAKTYLKSGAGVLYALLNTAAVAFAAQFMAWSSQAGIPGLQLIFLIKLVQLLVVLVALPFFRPKLTTENGRQTLLLVLSTIIENLGTAFLYLSFAFVVSGIAFGIIRGSVPFVSACIGFLFLKETVGAVDCFGIVFTVAGVMVVAVGMITENTSSTRLRSSGIVIARSLIGVQKVSVLTVLFYANLAGAVVLLVLTYMTQTPPLWSMPTQTAGYVIGLCLCACCGQFATRLALKTEKAGIAATIKTFTIPLAVLLDYIFLSEFPSPVKFGGVVLIVFGTGVVAVYTWWRHRKETLHKNLMERLKFGN
ncbi:hypothetical protein Bbelb_320380 [Branchiostoma belcheri]|nr:hypothetical protein Bbelb_320380 [Branchiostoma belcheri]